jgi:hypothetical protein
MTSVETTAVANGFASETIWLGPKEDFAPLNCSMRAHAASQCLPPWAMVAHWARSQHRIGRARFTLLLSLPPVNAISRRYSVPRPHAPSVATPALRRGDVLQSPRRPTRFAASNNRPRRRRKRESLNSGVILISRPESLRSCHQYVLPLPGRPVRCSPPRVESLASRGAFPFTCDCSMMPEQS